jgi:putative ABC transport system ATP-binding protein
MKEMENDLMPTVIRGQDIHKRYVMGKDNFVDALQGASIEVEQGDMVAVMGPSGSGKSTLLHILGCLDSLNAGEVWLGGRRVDTLSGRELTQFRREEVGFIFQTYNLVPSMNALENVALAAQYAGKGRREAREAAEAALARVGLADRQRHRPSELSGGQQQRVAIARSLINSPDILLCDEPTGNLDSKTGAGIMDLMSDLNRKGTTIIMVTHDSHIAEYSQRTIRIADGRIVS